MSSILTISKNNGNEQDEYIFTCGDRILFKTDDIRVINNFIDINKEINDIDLSLKQTTNIYSTINMGYTGHPNFKEFHEHLKKIQQKIEELKELIK